MYYYLIVWGYSSVGRALEWHSRGQGFESPYLHHVIPCNLIVTRIFYFFDISSFIKAARKSITYFLNITYKNLFISPYI